MLPRCPLVLAATRVHPSIQVEQGSPPNVPQVRARREASRAHLRHVSSPALIDFIHFFAFVSVRLQARTTICMFLGVRWLDIERLA